VSVPVLVALSRVRQVEGAGDQVLDADLRRTAGVRPSRRVCVGLVRIEIVVGVGAGVVVCNRRRRRHAVARTRRRVVVRAVFDVRVGKRLIEVRVGVGFAARHRQEQAPRAGFKVGVQRFHFAAGIVADVAVRVGLVDVAARVRFAVGAGLVDRDRAAQGIAAIRIRDRRVIGVRFIVRVRLVDVVVRIAVGFAGRHVVRVGAAEHVARSVDAVAARIRVREVVRIRLIVFIAPFRRIIGVGGSSRFSIVNYAAFLNNLSVRGFGLPFCILCGCGRERRSRRTTSSQMPLR
jgi:hypothetical protein